LQLVRLDVSNVAMKADVREELRDPRLREIGAPCPLVELVEEMSELMRHDEVGETFSELQRIAIDRVQSLPIGTPAYSFQKADGLVPVTTCSPTACGMP
jgi:hypothetical protein